MIAINQETISLEYQTVHILGAKVIEASTKIANGASVQQTMCRTCQLTVFVYFVTNEECMSSTPRL